MRILMLSLLMTAVVCAVGCGGDHRELVEEPLFLPREYLNDFYRTTEPLITEDVPPYLMDALTQLGWDTHSPVYHKFEPNGNLVVSLSSSLFVGRFGPLQRTISSDHFAPDGPSREFIDLLHKLQMLGDTMQTEAN